MDLESQDSAECFCFQSFINLWGDMDRQSILLSPNFPGPHEFHNFMGKVRIQQNTFFQSFINLFYFYASGGGWGMSHLCLFKNYEFSLGVVPPISICPSLLSAGIFNLSIYPSLLSAIYPSLLSASLNYLMNLGAISY